MLKILTNKKRSSTMMFAIDKDCTITDITKINSEKCKIDKLNIGWTIADQEKPHVSENSMYKKEITEEELKS